MICLQVRGGNGQRPILSANTHRGDAALDIALVTHRVKDDLDKLIKALNRHKYLCEQAAHYLVRLQPEHVAQGRIGDLHRSVRVNHHHAVREIIQ